ncbi:Mechanosensitive ion channel-domain-containing protein [Delphinella strobiligena]|nr:Mechanosensitive ion channel-domain-containing protein [Delphinella strobiligena]
MSLRSNTQRKASQRTPSRQGFSPIPNENYANMQSGDATIDIPLNDMQQRHDSNSPFAATNNDNDNVGSPLVKETTAQRERSRMFGGRRVKKVDSKGRPTRVGSDGEEITVNKMGRLYNKILEFSTFTRYLVYVTPLAACLAIPIIIGGTTAKDAKLGGVRICWFFSWIEIVWLSLWASKIVVHYFPFIFQFVVGVVSSGTRKYTLILKALEIPLSLVGWSITCLATFVPVMTRNPSNRAANDTGIKEWEKIMNEILGACVLSTCVLLIEKFFIQLISVNYHRKQFTTKIKESKRNIFLLGLLYEASRRLFPMYCPEFAEEDYEIGDQLNLALLAKGLGGSKSRGMQTRRGHARSGSMTPFRIIQDVGRIGDKVTAAFGNVAQEITGRQVFNPNSAHSIVIEALQKRRTSEALARRIWMSFVIAGREALYEEDIVDVLGDNYKQEAEEAFLMFDTDHNGDISLEEAVNTVVQISRDRKSLGTSMHDVDQAINVLDRILMSVCFIITIFTFIAFLNKSFLTTLATAGTTLLSLSFVFSVTAQEFLGSCIFIFVKHPFDVGDRVDIGTDKLAVDHISLLFTVFRRVAGTDIGRIVQIPNNVLNTLWIENVSRSPYMKEQLELAVSFDTSFEDIQILKNELLTFVTDKDNSRDFLPDIDVEVLGTSDMSKLMLRVEIRHKGNYGNEGLRAARRSKFMCALVAALRRVPIYAPGGGSDAQGSADNPSYSVTVDDSFAKEVRDAAAKAKEEKRLVRTKNATDISPEISRTKSASTPPLGLSATQNAIIQDINQVGYDPARDETWNMRDDSSTLAGERSSGDQAQRDQAIEEVRGVLRRATTKGKRRPGQQDATLAVPAVPTISEPGVQQPPIAYTDYAQQAEASIQADDYETYRTQAHGLQPSPNVPVSNQLGSPNFGPGLPTTPSAYVPDQQGNNYMQPYRSNEQRPSTTGQLEHTSSNPYRMHSPPGTRPQTTAMQQGAVTRMDDDDDAYPGYV